MDVCDHYLACDVVILSIHGVITIAKMLIVIKYYIISDMVGLVM